MLNVVGGTGGGERLIDRVRDALDCSSLCQESRNDHHTRTVCTRPPPTLSCVSTALATVFVDARSAWRVADAKLAALEDAIRQREENARKNNEAP